MMSSGPQMKLLSVRLADIWVECQREMVAMRQEIRHLKECLKTSKSMSKHLQICNETLVTIIESCRLDPLENKDVMKHIDSIRTHEEVIDRHKRQMKTLEDKHEFSVDDWCLKLFSDWNQLKHVKIETEDQFTQTDPCLSAQSIQCCDNSADTKINTISIVNDIQMTLNETLIEEPIGATNGDTNRSVAIDINDEESDTKSDNLFNGADVDVDYDLDDNSVKSEDLEDNKKDHMNDSNLELKTTRRSERKSRKTIAFQLTLKESPKKIAQRSDEKLTNDLALSSKPDNHQTGTEDEPKSDTSSIGEAIDVEGYSDDSECDDNSVKSEDFKCDNDDTDDSDFEVNSKRRSKRKAKKTNTSELTANESFTSERIQRTNQLVLHLKRDNHYICDEEGCDYKTGVKREIYRHKLDHKLSRLKVDDHYKCDESGCDYITVDKLVMSDHKKIHKLDEDLNPYDEQKLEEHKRIYKLIEEFKIDGKYVCNVNDCQYTTNRMMWFYTHYTKHRQKKQLHAKQVYSLKVDGKYVCSQPDCEFASQTNSVFYEHIKQHLTNIMVDSDQPYACNIANCVMTFKEIARLYRHQISKHPKRMLTCDWPGCDQQFKAIAYLVKHRDNIHLMKRIACEWPGCTYMAYNPTYLRQHQRCIHTNEKIFKCGWPGCQYRSSHNYAIIAHKRTHTGEKPYTCDWPECNYKCSQSCALTAHKRKHTGEKPYICPEKGCGKRFSSLSGQHAHRPFHNRKLMQMDRNNQVLVQNLDPKKVK